MHPGALATLVLSAFCQSSFGDDQITLQFKKSGAQGEVVLHSQMALPVSAMYPEYTILRSADMVSWQTVAGPITGSVGVSDEFLRVAVPLGSDHAFYRVVANVKLTTVGSVAGDAIYGYGTEFNRQLQGLGQLSLDDFVQRYSLTNQYLPQITPDDRRVLGSVQHGPGRLERHKHLVKPATI